MSSLIYPSNKFLNTNSGNTDLAGGTANIYIASVRVAGLQSNMNVQTDDHNNLISTPDLTAPYDISIIPNNGTGYLNIDARDVLINNDSIYQLFQYNSFCYARWSGTLGGNTVNINSENYVPLVNQSGQFTTGGDIYTVICPYTGFYSISLTDNITPLNNSLCWFQVSIIINDVRIPTIEDKPYLINMTGIFDLNNGDTIKIRYINRSNSLTAYTFNNTALSIHCVGN